MSFFETFEPLAHCKLCEEYCYQKITLDMGEQL